MFHGVLFGLIVLILIGASYDLYRMIGERRNRITAALLVAISVAMILQFFFSRIFPLKAQDRAIRAEENLRHFVLTGKLLDHRLAVKQIVALRLPLTRNSWNWPARPPTKDWPRTRSRSRSATGAPTTTGFEVDLVPALADVVPVPGRNLDGDVAFHHRLAAEP